MFEAVLVLLMSAAVLSHVARPFAAVMVVNWMINYAITDQYGFYAWVSAVDAVSFVALAFLTLRMPRWWSFLIAELAFAAVVVHALYWLAFGFGLYFGHQYQVVLNGAFLLSAIILVFGGYDIGRFVGSLLDRLSFSIYLRRRHVHSRAAPIQSRREEQK